MTGSNEVLVSPKYSRNTDGKKAVNRRTVQIFIWVCVTINLVALACVAIGFFSTWHFEYEYKEKVNNVMTDMEGHYGFWKICYSKKGEKGEMCVDTKGFGPPFDERKYLITQDIIPCQRSNKAFEQEIVPSILETVINDIVTYLPSFSQDIIVEYHPYCINLIQRKLDKVAIFCSICISLFVIETIFP